MNKIFIACPFIKFINGTDFINNDFRQFTEDLYDYGAKPLQSYSCSMDLDEAKSADLVIAIPDDSMGVAVELGWMSAMQKPVILVLNKNQTYTPLIYNINKITPGKVIFYENEEKKSLPDIKKVLEYYKKLMDGDEK